MILYIKTILKMNNNYTQELIDKYLEGRLTEKERKKFEKLYNENKEFREDVDFEDYVARALENEDIIHFRKRISDTMKKRKREQYLGWINKATMKYAAILVTVVALGFGAFSVFEKNYSSDDLFNKYYSSEQVNISRSSNTNIVEAVRYYQSGQYDNAIDQFKDLLEKDASNIAVRFYLGVSYVETNNYDKAIKSFRHIISDQDNLYIEHAEWYLGLCYLKNEEMDKAINQFTIIAQSEDNYYNKKAQNLLSKIDKEY